LRFILISIFGHETIDIAGGFFQAGIACRASGFAGGPLGGTPGE
jgi:hypothetical protein